MLSKGCTVILGIVFPILCSENFCSSNASSTCMGLLICIMFDFSV